MNAWAQAFGRLWPSPCWSLRKVNIAPQGISEQGTWTRSVSLFSFWWRVQVLFDQHKATPLGSWTTASGFLWQIFPKMQYSILPDTMPKRTLTWFTCWLLYLWGSIHRLFLNSSTLAHNSSVVGKIGGKWFANPITSCRIRRLLLSARAELQWDATPKTEAVTSLFLPSTRSDGHHRTKLLWLHDLHTWGV